MTLHDPLELNYARVQERAEEYARRRELQKLLREPDHEAAVAVWLGAGFIFVGDWMHALGERICPTCPDARAAIEGGAAGR